MATGIVYFSTGFLTGFIVILSIFTIVGFVLKKKKLKDSQQKKDEDTKND